MDYNLGFSDINLSSGGFQIVADSNPQYIDYSNIENINLLGVNKIEPLCISLKLANSKYQEVSFFVEKGSSDYEHSNELKRFSSLTKALVEKTKLEISYQIYPKYVGHIVNLLFGVLMFVLILAILTYLLFYSVSITGAGLFAFGAAPYGVYYLYGKIEKKKFGKQIIADGKMENLDIFIAHKFGKTKVS